MAFACGQKAAPHAASTGRTARNALRPGLRSRILQFFTGLPALRIRQGILRHLLVWRTASPGRARCAPAGKAAFRLKITPERATAHPRECPRTNNPAARPRVSRAARYNSGTPLSATSFLRSSSSRLPTGPGLPPPTGAPLYSTMARHWLVVPSTSISEAWAISCSLMRR